MNKQKWRVVITLILIVLGVIASWKTVKLWSMDEAARDAMNVSDPDGYKDLVDGSMRLGLDLQGGIHTVVRVKLEEIPEAGRDDAVERVKEIIRNRVDPEGITEPVIQTQGADRIIIDLPGWKDEERAERLIGEVARLEFKMLEDMGRAVQILNQIDSVVAEVNQREIAEGTPSMEALDESADVTAAETETTDADDLLAELTDETADSAVAGEKSEEDILAELLGDSAGDTTGAALDAEKPLTSLLLYSQYNDRTGTNWPGLTFAARDKKA
ncbi:MAG TPA: hypothetical protein VLB27_11310, partial [candidate division Zixibacteria bacterium]|nr:hypothetical protein [candidate division Zixibacteria bacterium]